ncbi:hypothetical protein AAH994_07105 [Weeksellaceae bacterium A-14]
MWKAFVLAGLLMWGISFSQQKISGKIQSEDGDILNAVLIVDMATNERFTSDDSGNFTVSAGVGDELRFIRTGFMRESHIVTAADASQPLLMTLTRLVQEIEPVKMLHLTGDIDKDSKTLHKENPMDRVNKEIDVPAPPEKPREKPSETVNDILLPVLAGQLNVQAIYDVVSGKSRKQRSLYQYEDFQDKVKWIRERTATEFFTDAGIPENKVDEFIQFALLTEPQISRAIKEKNIDKALLNFETVFPVYIEKMKKDE